MEQEKAFKVSGEFLEVNRLVWDKSESIELQAGYDHVGLGYTKNKFEMTIEDYKITSQPNIVAIGTSDLRGCYGIDVDENSNELRSCDIFWFSPSKITSIITELRNMNPSELDSCSEEIDVIQQILPQIHMCPPMLSKQLMYISDELMKLHFEKKSAIRDYLIELKIKIIFVSLYRVGYFRHILNNYLHQYDTNNTFSFLIYKIEKEVQKPWNISDLSRECGVSESSVYRFFQKNLGVSPNRYVWERKIAKAKELLIGSPHLNVAEIGYSIGIDRPAYFTRVFKQYTGKTPVNFRKNASKSFVH